MEAGGDVSKVSILLCAVLALSSLGLAGCMGPQQSAQFTANTGGCYDSSSAQITDQTFQYGGAAACKTDTETYDWQNSATSARVQYGSGIAQGELVIEIRDAANRTVFESTVTPGTESRQEETDIGVPSAGSAASWTIELTFRNVTGNLGLQITPPR